MAAVGDPQWLITQGVAAGVILGGFWATGRLPSIDKVLGDLSSSPDGSSSGPSDENSNGDADAGVNNEVCPMCFGREVIKHAHSIERR
jgi:hypothetical protein